MKLLVVLLALLWAFPGLAAAQNPTPPATAAYVASSQGRVYYWIGCTHRWGRLAPANLRFFETADDAEAAGYTPSQSQGCGRQPDPAAATAPAAARTCVVARIVDGDTVACEAGVRVRLLLIDAPELDQSDFGLRSRLALAELLPVGDSVALVTDVQTHDRYGRLLAYLFTRDGRLINEELVRRGYALVAVYPPNVRYVERVRAAAEEAQLERRGLWETSAFECPPAARRRRECR